jgi:hypothetical protein
MNTKQTDATHSGEVADMAAALRASILCRDLTLQERRRELERTKAALASTGSSSSSSSSSSGSSTQQNMLTALEEARQASHLRN